MGNPPDRSWKLSSLPNQSEHKKAPANGGKRLQTTAMKGNRIDPLTGVVKPEILAVHIRQCVAGNINSRNYVRGAVQFLERKPPNPFIVPLLKKAMQRFNESNQRT